MLKCQPNHLQFCKFRIYCQGFQNYSNETARQNGRSSKELKKLFKKEKISKNIQLAMVICVKIMIDII